MLEYILLKELFCQWLCIYLKFCLLCCNERLILKVRPEKMYFSLNCNWSVTVSVWICCSADMLGLFCHSIV